MQTCWTYVQTAVPRKIYSLYHGAPFVLPQGGKLMKEARKVFVDFMASAYYIHHTKAESEIQILCEYALNFSRYIISN